MPGARSKFGNRQDSNHDDCKLQLSMLPGSQVIDMSGMGDDFPDLILGLRAQWFFVEVKTASGRLSKGQKIFHATAVGPTAVVRDREDCLDLAASIYRGCGVPAHLRPARKLDARDVR
jgi:hypothetical protein